MKAIFSSLLCVGLALAVCADGPTPGVQKPVKAQVIVAKPAPDEPEPGTAPEPPPLTEKIAKSAAMLAIAFNSLPNAVYDKKEATVIWTIAGQFKTPDVRYDRYSVFLQADGRTYAGMDFARQEGDVLTLQAFELETHEGPYANVKVKVVEKDIPDSSFFIFDYNEMAAATIKALKELPKN